MDPRKRTGQMGNANCNFINIIATPLDVLLLLLLLPLPVVTFNKASADVWYTYYAYHYKVMWVSLSIAFRQVLFPLADYLQLGPSGTGKANLKKLRQGHMLGVLKFVICVCVCVGYNSIGNALQWKLYFCNNGRNWGSPVLILIQMVPFKHLAANLKTMSQSISPKITLLALLTG